MVSQAGIWEVSAVFEVFRQEIRCFGWNSIYFDGFVHGFE